MSYVPEFMALYEIAPYIEYLPLNNESIRVAVKDYLEGGEKKDTIIKKYGKIEDWNTTEVTDMSCLFEDVINFISFTHINTIIWNFNEDISKWDTSSVTSMTRMFFNAKKFNQDISSWDTSNVKNMEGMFNGAKSFNRENAPWYQE